MWVTELGFQDALCTASPPGDPDWHIAGPVRTHDQEDAHSRSLAGPKPGGHCSRPVPKPEREDHAIDVGK